jgi:L-threonylcarbamoyladenylate synthase
LREGGILVYPTETAYALGCDATNPKAVKRIFKIKHRPLSKTLPLIAGSPAMVKRFCQLSKTELKLAQKYWPGPFTMVLVRRRDRPLCLSGIVAKDKTIAIRVSSNKIARELSHRLGRPLVSTSANLFGKGECYSVSEVEKQLGCGSGIIIVGGKKLKKQKSSTIVRVKKDGVEIIRQGKIKI